MCIYILYTNHIHIIEIIWSYHHWPLHFILYMFHPFPVQSFQHPSNKMLMNSRKTLARKKQKKMGLGYQDVSGLIQIFNILQPSLASGDYHTNLDKTSKLGRPDVDVKGDHNKCLQGGLVDSNGWVLYAIPIFLTCVLEKRLELVLAESTLDAPSSWQLWLWSLYALVSLLNLQRGTAGMFPNDQKNKNPGLTCSTPPKAETKRLQILPFDEGWSTLRMRATHEGMGNLDNPGEGEQWLHKDLHWSTMTQGFWPSLGRPLKTTHPQNWEGCFHTWDIKLCCWQQVSKST